MAFSPGTPFPGAPPQICQDFFPIFSPIGDCPSCNLSNHILVPPCHSLAPPSQIIPRSPSQSRPHSFGWKQGGGVSSHRSSFSLLHGSYPQPPQPVFLSGLFLQSLLYTRVNPQRCPFLEGPRGQISQILQSSPLPQYLPHQNPLATGLLPCHSFSPMSSLALHDPSLLELPHKTSSPPEGPSHTRTLSQPPPPTRVRAGAGPTGGWGAVGPPVVWASGQHGGGSGGEKTAACPGPAGPASPAAGRASGTGGRVGDNSSRRRWGRGEEETRVSPGQAGEGESRWTGEGRVNPRPAGPAQRSHLPPGTPASRPPPWGPAPARGNPAGGAGPNLAVHTYHGNNRAIGHYCQELNQSQSRTAVARRRRCGRRSRAQTKGGSGAPLPPPSLPPETALSARARPLPGIQL